MFLLTNNKQYYNFEKEQWKNDYKLATPLSDDSCVPDTKEFRWIVIKSYCPGPLTVIVDKITSREYEYPYIVDSSARIDWENSSERKEQEQKRESQIVAKKKAIELANLIKEDNQSHDYWKNAQELAELVLSLTS